VATEFYAPKRECVTLEVLPEMSVLAAGFTDGFLRFFDLVTNVSLGALAFFDAQN
jgi:hypothetical protein